MTWQSCAASTCDKTVISQHPASHFLIISSVLCEDGNENNEQLVHLGEFGSKCLDAYRQHRSDDTISTVIWGAMSVQSSYFIVGKCVTQPKKLMQMCVYIEEYEGFSSEQSTNIPNGDMCCGCHLH